MLPARSRTGIRRTAESNVLPFIERPPDGKFRSDQGTHWDSRAGSFKRQEAELAHFRDLASNTVFCSAPGQTYNGSPGDRPEKGAGEMRWSNGSSARRDW